MVNRETPGVATVEVFYDGEWQALCNKSWTLTMATEVCREHGCIRASRISDFTDSEGKLETRQKRRVYCSKTDKYLKDCHHFIEYRDSCSPARVVCDCLQEVCGTDSSTILSIIFGIILLVVLLAIGGPPIYRKIRKKFCVKKQRQWIGPTGAGHNVSFHQRSIINPRPQVTNMDRNNEYSEPPKKTSYLSPYPALERISTISTQPHENSSDNSDYDFHDVHRL